MAQVHESYGYSLEQARHRSWTEGNVIDLPTLPAKHTIYWSAYKSKYQPTTNDQPFTNHFHHLLFVELSEDLRLFFLKSPVAGHRKRR